MNINCAVCIHIKSAFCAQQEGLQEALETGPPSVGLSRSEGATGSGSAVATPIVSEDPMQTIERPKLSLKPRSQPVDVVPADSGSVKER